MDKKTKIVATVSDMKCDIKFIEELYKAGTNVIRLNTAHQTQKDSLKIVNNVRIASENIALMIDTKGPEIRTNKSEYKLDLKKGDRIKIKGDASCLTTPECIYTPNEVSCCGFN